VEAGTLRILGDDANHLLRFRFSKHVP
jgi:hypothetical protein